MAISKEEQKQVLLRELRNGATMVAAARAAGLHRPHVYRLADSDPDFWALVQAAQEATARSNRDPLALSDAQIEAFCVALRRTGRLELAARAVGLERVPNVPDRVRPCDMTAAQREVLRRALEEFRELGDQKVS